MTHSLQVDKLFKVQTTDVWNVQYKDTIKYHIKSKPNDIKLYENNTQNYLIISKYPIVDSDIIKDENVVTTQMSEIKSCFPILPALEDMKALVADINLDGEKKNGLIWLINNKKHNMSGLTSDLSNSIIHKNVNTSQGGSRKKRSKRNKRLSSKRKRFSYKRRKSRK